MEETIKRHPLRESVYTTGAFLERISYQNSRGETVFGWLVAGFEDDTFQGSRYLSVEPYASNLKGLTPDDEEEPEENAISWVSRIQKMLLDYGATKLDLDEYCLTGCGYIATVYTDMVEYAHGETEEFENLEDDTLEDLVCVVERQIEANKKAFEKSQS